MASSSSKRPPDEKNGIGVRRIMRRRSSLGVDHNNDRVGPCDLEGVLGSNIAAIEHAMSFDPLAA